VSAGQPRPLQTDRCVKSVAQWCRAFANRRKGSNGPTSTRKYRGISRYYGIGRWCLALTRECFANSLTEERPASSHWRLLDWSEQGWPPNGPIRATSVAEFGLPQAGSGWGRKQILPGWSGKARRIRMFCRHLQAAFRAQRDRQRSTPPLHDEKAWTSSRTSGRGGTRANRRMVEVDKNTVTPLLDGRAQPRGSTAQSLGAVFPSDP